MIVRMVTKTKHPVLNKDSERHEHTTYNADEEYDLPDEVAEHFVSNGWAVYLDDFVVTQPTEPTNTELSVDKARHISKSKVK